MQELHPNDITVHLHTISNTFEIIKEKPWFYKTESKPQRTESHLSVLSPVLYSRGKPLAYFLRREEKTYPAGGYVSLKNSDRGFSEHLL